MPESVDVKPGTVVSVGPWEPSEPRSEQNGAIGVIVRTNEDSVVVMLWMRGRWRRPSSVSISTISAAPSNDHQVALARKSVASNHGVIPHGGMYTVWVRVWPTGAPP